MLKRLAFAALAATLAAALRPASAVAQKALVYCPAAIDGTGCNRIVDALGPRFAEGVDRGYDGSNGTVDLRKVDLQHYSVVVVPSLADNDAAKPFALLRDVAPRFKMAINGRVAVYAGAPDQGGANRDAKNSLITNLATWASGGHKYTTGLVGLVAFLDLSADAASRYDWVRAMSPADVSADADLQTFAAVESSSDASLSVGGSAIKYGNMASLGLHIGKQGAARMREAATAGANRKAVLLKYSLTPDVSSEGASFSKAKIGGASFSTSGSEASSATTSGPALSTDKQDYLPGDTVTFTGTGFAPNDTVVITLHEDPAWIDPDRAVTAVADGSGSFTSHTFIVDQHDFGVTFTATAVGSPSGLTAQHTFTDGNATNISGTVRDASNSLPLAGVTVSCTVATGCNATVIATTDASGNYVFSGGNKLTFDGNNPVTMGLTFTKAGYATGTLTLTNVTNSDVRANQNISLTPAGPTKLAFTNVALTGAVGACLGPLSIQTQNASNVATNVASNTTVNLVTDNGGTGAGAFYSSNTCSAGSAVPSITIATGANSGSVFYQATARGTGNHGITISATGLTSANQTETITKATQAALSLTVPLEIVYGTTGTASTTGGSGTGSVTFSATGSTGCAVDATGIISVSNATGTCSISASKAGDNDYNGPVTDGPKTVTLVKATQATVSVTAPSTVTYGSPGTATASGGDGTGAYSFAAGSSTGCSVSGTTVTVTDATGTCALTATRAEDSNYNISAASAPFTVTLKKATQAALSLTVPANVTFGTTGTASASGGSGGGAVSYSAGTSTGCSVDATTGVVSVSDASGTCAISASKAGDNNYEGPITDGPKSVTLKKASQSTVTVTAPGAVTFGTTETAAASGGDGTGAYSFSAGASTGCSVIGTTVSVSNAIGTCQLTATRAGDNNHEASATSAPFTVSLVKANQSAVSITAPNAVTYGTTGTAVATGGDGTGAYSFSAGASTGCSVSGTTVSVSNASGTCVLTATRAADNNYNISGESAPFTVTLNRANQTTAVLVSAPGSVTYGTTGTAAASGGDGTGAYTFSAGASTGCSVAGTTVSVSDATGSCVLTATRAADNNYNISTASAPFTVTLNKATQAALDLTVPASVTYGTTGTASTSGGSGSGAVTFSASGSTGCTVNSSTGVISVTDASALCSISASKAGDNNYLGPVTNGPKSVTLNKATQSALNLTVPASVTYGSTSTASTSGGSGGGAVTFGAPGSTGCAVNANTGVISVSDASGTCSISASKAGDNNYNGPVTDGPKSVTLNKANQTAVSVTAPSSLTFGSTGTAAASGGDGTGAYSFSAGASTGCSVGGTTVSVSNASGTCQLTATRAGDNNYNPSAASAPFTVTLVKANQSAVSVTGPSAVTYGTTGTAAASGGDGTGAYGFDAGTSNGCSVAGTTVSVSNASGTCALTATRAGDNNYNPSAVSSSFPVTLNKANQSTVSVTAPTSVTFGTTGTAAATGGNGTGAYEFSAGASAGCSVSGTTVSVSNASMSCALTATKAGDNNYNVSAPSASFTVTLVKADQVISWADPAAITYGTTLAGILNATVTVGDGTLTYKDGATSVTTASVLNAGSHTLTATAAATSNYKSAVKSVSLTVNPAAASIVLGNLVQPVNNVGSPTATATPVGSNTPVSVGFTFTYTVNGVPTQTKPTQVGVYPLGVDIVSGANYTGHSDGYFVIYDPAGGFVTGGGWIVADPGSCVQANAPTGVCTTVTGGRANFGFVSKYEKGANLPSGNTEFQFQVGNLNFKSTSYQWLVVSGARAQYKGSGTVNGQVGYEFILTAIDGGLPGGNNQDRFRIKITYNGNVVFDNQINATDTDALSGTSTALAGGSINIKK